MVKLRIFICRGVEVKSVVPFGCFVELNAFTQALVHVSELDTARITNPADHYQVGDKMDIKVLEKNQIGQFRLAM